MLIILILLSLAGFTLTLLKNYLRSENEDHQSENLQDDHTVKHIKRMLFLEIPLERIVMVYFLIVSLVYSGMLLFDRLLPGVELALLLLSASIFLLLIYNLVMAFKVSESLNWRTITFLSMSAFVALILFFRPEIVGEQLLQDAFPYLLTVHLLGLILGFGGALILDMMIFHFLKNYSISNREAVIMHIISQMIVLGLILLIVSGIPLVLTDTASYLENPRFLMKMTAVGVVILNGIVLNLYIAPKMGMISLREEERESNETLMVVSFISGATSLVSWFAVFIFAMIEILERFSYSTLLIAFLILLGIAVTGALLTKRKYEMEAKKE